MFALLSCLLTLSVSSVYGAVFKTFTPPMGWNSFNAYACNISEGKVMMNAQSLVDMGLRDLGYTLVTTDCAWNDQERENGKMKWNSSTFPSGGKALGDYLHDRALKFGMYSGAGYKQCNPYPIAGSRDFEDIDAQSFAEWGADSLKYDNCYMANGDEQNGNGPEYSSSKYFEKMYVSLGRVARNIQYFVCQWGNGDDVGHWASRIANTWRISGDIRNDWASIWRITNQVVAYHSSSAPGAYPDMDMLIVGLGKLTPEEERFHFKMWAINKSPLIIGAILDGSFPKHSLETLSKTEIIAINQDPDGKPANLVRRFTEEEWDVWHGDLAGGKQVLGIANWWTQDRKVQFDLRSLSIESANVRDPWTQTNTGRRTGLQTFDLAGHELKLWVLSNIEYSKYAINPTGSYSAANASLTDKAIYGKCPDYTVCNYVDRIRFLGKGSSATFSSVFTKTSGTKRMGIEFVNFDHSDNNIRRLEISVNGGKPKWWAMPLSGQSWNEKGRLNIEVEGFVDNGNNSIVFSGVGENWAPDIVGFDIFESLCTVDGQEHSCWNSSVTSGGTLRNPRVIGMMWLLVLGATAVATV